MDTKDIRQKLHELIDAVEDKKAEAIYTLLTDETDITAKRRNLVMEEREKYLLGEGKSYSWNEVKDMAVNKDKRDDISN